MKDKCKECEFMAETVKFIQEKLEPASKRAYENTKLHDDFSGPANNPYDFHAGYNSACKNFLERIEKKLSGDNL